jgi:hypothetical protein
MAGLFCDRGFLIHIQAQDFPKNAMIVADLKKGDRKTAMALGLSSCKAAIAPLFPSGGA